MTANTKTARWKLIRYEEIADGFVSTSSNNAVFSRTVASFGPSPIIQSSSSSSSELENSNNSDNSNDVWCRFRFSPSVSSSSSSSSSSCASPRATASQIRNYGERAVVGFDLTKSSTSASSSYSSSLTSSTSVQVLLRCDGMICLKLSQKQKEESKNKIQLSSLLLNEQEEDEEALCYQPIVTPLVLPSPSSSTKNSASCERVDASEEVHLFRCGSCIFPPGSTITTKYEFVSKNLVQLNWIVFSAPDPTSKVINISMTLPLQKIFPSSSSSSSSNETFSVDYSVGQCDSFGIVGNRLPSTMGNNPNSSSQEELSSSAEFTADFVIGVKELIRRSPTLLLSAAGFIDAVVPDRFLPKTTKNTSSSSSSSSSGSSSGSSETGSTPSSNSSSSSSPNSSSSVAAASSSPSRNSSFGVPLVAPLSEAALSADASSNAAAAAQHNISSSESATTVSSSSSGFSTTADVLRLATTSPLVKSQISGSSQFPTYLNLRAENAFARLEQIVHSL